MKYLSRKEENMEYNIDRLVNRCKELGIILSDIQINQFISYYEYLIEINKVMNLTAITEFDDVVDKHFIDSLTCIKAVDMSKVHSIADIGTGAGFPGIPVKIIWPDIKVLLVDSLNKRIGFLNDVIRLLNLKSIEAIHSRAEEVGKDLVHREKYDLVLSRAVSNLAVLSEYCLPLVRPGGAFLSYKTEGIENELKEAENAIKVLGGQIKTKTDLIIPGTDIKRSLINIKKVKPTPKKYPRKAGTPLKEPL